MLFEYWMTIIFVHLNVRTSKNLWLFVPFAIVSFEPICKIYTLSHPTHLLIIVCICYGCFTSSFVILLLGSLISDSFSNSYLIFIYIYNFPPFLLCVCADFLSLFFIFYFFFKFHTFLVGVLRSSKALKHFQDYLFSLLLI